MRFRIAWWNTRLLHSPKAEASLAENRHGAAAVIAWLFWSFDLSAIVLGEVTPEDLTALMVELGHGPLELHSLEGKHGRSLFNMGVIFRSDRTKVLSPLFHREVIGGRKMKRAVSFEMILPDGSEVNVYAVHWRSRREEPEESPVRTLLAHSLRQDIEGLLKQDQMKNIIVLGDFNDEPSDLSVRKYLLASRDASEVHKKTNLLYNPFWRYFAPTGLYANGGAISPSRGSYHYSKGLPQTWYVFDQILFSSSFLGLGDWHLDEGSTCIVEFPAALGTPLGHGGFFDHYPVLGAIERDGDEPIQ